MNSRIERMTFASVYPLYVSKVERKGRTRDELDEVIRWITGLDDDEIHRHLDAQSTFRVFFDDARPPATIASITGVVCGVRVEEVEDPLLRNIRLLDKVVDELARGKAVDRIIRR
ncbi:DUF2200 domain-containing protein [Microbacterium sp.]|uniref:DUF2200 domain-containing protein n=1 Tax=Microbacterium sp. TaxID=51671 RepID=UPI0039E70014